MNPTAPAPSLVTCPSCNAALTIPAGRSGLFACPRCKGRVAVPAPLAPTTPPNTAAPVENRGGLVCAILSCVLGGVSALTVCLSVYLALPTVVLGVIGIVVGRSKRTETLGVVGIALAVFGVLALAVLWLTAAGAFISPKAFSAFSGR